MPENFAAISNSKLELTCLFKIVGMGEQFPVNLRLFF